MAPTTPPPAALAVGAAAVQRLVSGPARPASLPRAVPAVALATASAAFLGTSIREFRRSRTTVNPMAPESASALVVEGPHRISRNPMYLGMAGLLVAHALALGRWPALGPAGAFVALIDRVQIPREEAALAERFGSAYQEYCARVPRWAPLTK